MTKVTNLERTRGYRPRFTVHYHGSQNQHQRFGQDHSEGIRLMLDSNDSEDYPVDFEGEWPDFPRVARLRMNLTALSQHYNLYFVAYRGYIYVYRPNQTPATNLDRSPLVILGPTCSQTPMAAFTSGHVNRPCPHEVNHVKVGDLGDLEILLIGRDNGDVVAWYTRDIARFAQDRLRQLDDGETRPPLDAPRHFFADNVGVSAWGLAIHSASRLIAVSANTSEVTVFAFALDNAEDGDDQDKEEEEEEEEEEARQLPTPSNKSIGTEPRYVLGCAHSPSLVMENPQGLLKAAARLGKKFRKRDRPWRIIIPLDVDASNLPNVVFCDDEDGQADRIAAIDINGNLFIAAIWRIGTTPVKIPPHNVQDVNGLLFTPVTGWNVLPITDAQLRPTRTLRAAIGMPPKDTVYRGRTERGAWVDISKGMVHVPHDAGRDGHRGLLSNFDPVDHSTDLDGIPPSTFHHPHGAAYVSLSPKVRRPEFDKNDNFDIGGDRPVRIAMTMVPATGDHYGEFKSAEALVKFVRGQAKTRTLQMPRARSLQSYRSLQCLSPVEGNDLLRGVSFLRAYSEGAEILSLEPKEEGCGVVCHHVLTNVNHSDQPFFWDMRFGDRCSMILTIPELNLVVLGSMCGRVALLTLTKPPPSPTGSSKFTPRRTFRVEAVLPLDTEDRAGERPSVCLLGMAVSPVPQTCVQGLSLRKTKATAYGGRKASKTQAGSEAPTPKRWRLILNYMDHTILQYDIATTRQDDEEAEGIHVRKGSQGGRRRRNADSSSSGSWSLDEDEASSKSNESDG